MLKKIIGAFILCLIFNFALAQTVKTPNEIYKELFVDVQMQQVFADGKTFVD